MNSMTLFKSLVRHSTLRSCLILQLNTIKMHPTNSFPSCLVFNRNFSIGTMKMCQQGQQTAASTASRKNESVNINPSHAAYNPTQMEKRFLVWTGKYKTVEEVPNLVSPEVMERCRSKLRIRIANIMMVLTLIGCYLMVRSGKKAAERGETVQKMNLDWHKKYNEEAAAKEAEGKPI